MKLSACRVSAHLPPVYVPAMEAGEIGHTRSRSPSRSSRKRSRSPPMNVFEKLLDPRRLRRDPAARPDVRDLPGQPAGVLDEVCGDFVMREKCFFGAQCKRLHPVPAINPTVRGQASQETQLRADPIATPDVRDVPGAPIRVMREVCRNYMSSRCAHGDKCMRFHPVDRVVAAATGGDDAVVPVRPPPIKRIRASPQALPPSPPVISLSSAPAAPTAAVPVAAVAATSGSPPRPMPSPLAPPPTVAIETKEVAVTVAPSPLAIATAAAKFYPSMGWTKLRAPCHQPSPGYTKHGNVLRSICTECGVQIYCMTIALSAVWHTMIPDEKLLNAALWLIACDRNNMVEMLRTVNTDEFGLSYTNAVPTAPPPERPEGFSNVTRLAHQFTASAKLSSHDLERAQESAGADDAFTEDNPPLQLAEFMRLTGITDERKVPTITEYATDLDWKSRIAIKPNAIEKAKRKAADAIDCYRGRLSRCPAARVLAYAPGRAVNSHT